MKALPSFLVLAALLALPFQSSAADAAAPTGSFIGAPGVLKIETNGTYLLSYPEEQMMREYGKWKWNAEKQEFALERLEGVVLDVAFLRSDPRNPENLRAVLAPGASGLLANFDLTFRRGELWDQTQKFIFYAVLEGCYEDGLNTNDIAQVLMTTEKGAYMHFVYSCPVCTPTIHALEAYRSRPNRFNGLKTSANTFGVGLDYETHRQLNSAKVEERMVALNTLVQRWIARRITSLRLTVAERTKLQKDLEAKRKQGTRALERFKKDAGFSFYVTPAFLRLNECAVCNGAVGEKLKVPSMP